MSKSLHLCAAMALAIGMAGLAASVPAAATEPILLMVDRAKVMRISRPADTVILGNPSIADATIRDNQTLIITGRSYGTTNLIVLDRDGQPIADELLAVRAGEETMVTVYRRAARESFSCTPVCEPVLMVGDATGGFSAITAQIEARNALAQGGR